MRYHAPCPPTTAAESPANYPPLSFHNAMSNDVIGFVSLIFGGVIAALLTYAYFLWREGSRQLHAPAAVKKDNAEKLKKAQAKAKGGRNKQFIAMLAIIFALIFLCAFLLFMGGV